jgi:Zn-dependent M28 family amino/carboxypeptidase
MSVDIARIRHHIEILTQTVRPAESVKLEECRKYVAGQLEDSGWSVDRSSFVAEVDTGESLHGVNLVARGADFDASAPRLCVGAHLDSRPDSLGADDNASAVATLLEIARLCPESMTGDPQLQLELVAFDLEENGILGGAFHAKAAREAEVDLRGMVSLEMLGYCDSAPNSQQLPKKLQGLYPTTGDFIAIIGNQISHELIHAFRDGMQTVEGLPVETLAVPQNGELLQATRLSDHSPFWDEGFSALMITDTSFMRNPHYHQMSDTIDTLDMQFLERVANGCVRAVRQIVINGL